MSAFRHMKPLDSGYFIAIIGDEDTVAGFALTGIGQVEQDGSANFLIVRQKTTQDDIEKAFKNFTERTDVAVLLINQHIATSIRHLISAYNKPLPTIVEVPSKGYPFNPDQDALFKKVLTRLGGQVSQPQ